MSGPATSPAPSEASPRARAGATALRALLHSGPEDLYPMAFGELPQAWTRAALEGLDRLEAGLRLDEVDGFGSSLVQGLLLLARGPVARGLLESVGRRRLLGELILNIAEPGRINQGHKGTCSVTCIESWVAERYPAEYARLVAGLCSPAGGVGLRNGEALVRDAARLVWQPEEARRTPVSRLFQAAAMELAYPELDYHDGLDLQLPESGQGEASGTGVGLGAFDRLLEGVSGQPWSVLTDQNAVLARALNLPAGSTLDLARDGLGIIARALASGQAAFVTLASPAPPSAPPSAPAAGNPLRRLPHKIRVLALHDDHVEYDDPLDPDAPWIPDAPTTVLDARGRCRMARSDFQRLMVELSYPPDCAPSQDHSGSGISTSAATISS